MKELLRRLLHSALSSTLRLRSHRYVPPTASRCLVLAPHQDDEAFGCAGLILAHRLAGLPIDVLYLTDGSASHPSHPSLAPAAIAQIRRAEARLAMHHLGVPPTSLHFLDAPDGTLAHLLPTAAEALAERLGSTLVSLMPTHLLLPCRDDGSSEHKAAFFLTKRALALARLHPTLLEYPIWARWSPPRLCRPGLLCRRVWRHHFPATLAIKRAAIAAYASQLQPTPPWTHAMLPPRFRSFFEVPEEFFFEY